MGWSLILYHPCRGGYMASGGSQGQQRQGCHLFMAQGRRYASFGISQAQPAPPCHWQSFPHSSELHLFWFGAKRKGAAAVWSRAQLHQPSNCRALHSCSRRARPSRRVSSPASEPSQLPPGFVLSLFFQCFCVGGGKLCCDFPWQYTAFVFPKSMWPRTGLVTIFALPGKTMLGTVFGKCFCLFSNEHPFLCKALSLFYALLLILLWLLWFFTTVWLQFIIFPSVSSTVRRGWGEGSSSSGFNFSTVF